MHAQVGDEIEVDTMELGLPARKGKITAVHGQPTNEHFTVRWSDGHESTFFPGSTTHLVRPSD